VLYTDLRWQLPYCQAEHVACQLATMSHQLTLARTHPAAFAHHFNPNCCCCCRPRPHASLPSPPPQNLERLFVSHQELWTSAIEAVGVLDCLMALAGAALAADGTMCRPTLLKAPTDTQGRPSGGVFKATQLRHPAGIAGAAYGSFVPNDICLGGEAPGFILLTGPNMGGKSTLLRQVCLAAVLAQVRAGDGGGGAASC
jgi:hypothetical protein